jgi:hypothetical protein
MPRLEAKTWFLIAAATKCSLNTVMNTAQVSSRDICKIACMY